MNRSDETDASIHRAGSYDRMTIVLHWAVAAIVLLQWLGGQTIDWFPKGDARVAARSVHILLGALLALLVVWRIVWRARYGVRLPQAAEGLVGTAARVVHFALYFALTAVVTLGLLSAALRGDSIFGLFHIPHLGNYADAVRHALANQIVDWHGLAANFILVLAGFHASAALIHHYFLSGKILHRMLPS